MNVQKLLLAILASTSMVGYSDRARSTADPEKD